MSDHVERLRAELPELPELRRLPEEYQLVILRMPVEAADRVRERMSKGPLGWREVLE